MHFIIGRCISLVIISVNFEFLMIMDIFIVIYAGKITKPLSEED